MQLTPEQLAADENTSPEELSKLAQQSLELTRIVAKNANADPELLRLLSTSTDYITRQNVAINPNTPTPILLDLGAEFPQELLANPILSLLLLENVNFLEQIPLKALRSLVKQDNVPEILVVQYAIKESDKHFLLDLTINPQTSLNILEKLITTKDADVLEAAKLHINYPRPKKDDYENIVKQKIIELSQDIITGDYYKVIALIILKLIPNELIDCMSQTRIGECLLQEIKKCSSYSELYIPISLVEKFAKNSRFGSRILSDPNTPVSILTKLAEDKNNSLRFAIASNPNTPISTLEKLAEDTDKSVRLNLVLNPNTPIAIAEKIIEDLEQSDRAYIARQLNNVKNIVIPTPILAKLLEDSDSEVRAEVARNPRTPISIADFIKLSEDSDIWVRRSVARNPNTPISILEKLAEDPKVRSSVASNLNIPISILEKLAEDSNEDVRDSVARNHNTPISILEKLAEDKERNVKLSLLRNPNTPINLLEKLSEDSQIQLQLATKDLASHPNTSPKLLERLLKKVLENSNNNYHLSDRDSILSVFAKNQSTLPYLLESIFNNIKPFCFRSTSRAIIVNPNTPISILEDLLAGKYGDANTLYVDSLTENPNLPIDLWKQIIKNDNTQNNNNKFFPIISRFLEQHPDKISIILEDYVQSGSSFVRLIILPSFAVSETILAKIAKSIYWSDRYAVTQNSNTSVKLLQTLANDSNYVVRAAAEARLQHTS